MFDHIAKRPRPSPLPVAAIVVIIAGIVMVIVMARTLVPTSGEAVLDHAPGVRGAVAQLPELSPKLEAQVRAGESKPLDVTLSEASLQPDDATFTAGCT